MNPAVAPPPADPGARRSLRARLAAGPVARAIARVDVALYLMVRRRARGAAGRWVARFSATGQHAAVWLALGALGALLDRSRRRQWLRAAGAVELAYLLNAALKALLRRRRPAFEELPHLIVTPTQLSFPSAHATSSFAAARAYGALAPRGPLYAIATAMAASRVYLGVHFPSDIAAGAALGALLGRAGR